MGWVWYFLPQLAYSNVIANGKRHCKSPLYILESCFVSLTVAPEEYPAKAYWKSWWEYWCKLCVSVFFPFIPLSFSKYQTITFSIYSAASIIWTSIQNVMFRGLKCLDNRGYLSYLLKHLTVYVYFMVYWIHRATQ